MKNEVISCSDMIQAAYNNIEKSAFEKNNKFSLSWKKILTSIRTYNSDSNVGQNLFDNSNVVEIKNNILLIEANHPGWIQMFQLHKNYILKGLKMYVPELNINSLAFRLKGSNARLSNVNYDSELKNESRKLNRNIEKEEEIIKKYEETNKLKSETENKLGNKSESKNEEKIESKSEVESEQKRELKSEQKSEKKSSLPEFLLEKFKEMEETSSQRANQK